ncbi:MAG: hypothetical protein Fur0032_10630 [Terrimicrobiaceae bacterium]
MQLNSSGIATQTNTLALQTTPLTNIPVKIAPGFTRELAVFPLRDSAGRLYASFSYWVGDTASSQNLVRFPSIATRAYATTLREVPLILTNLSTLTTNQISDVNQFASNANWQGKVPSVPSFNGIFTNSPPPGVDSFYFNMDTRSDLVSFLGTPKIDLRRLKFYLDSLASTQTAGNPKARAVEALVGQSVPGLDPVTAWGGGDLRWLVSSSNPSAYTLAEARQIVASLVDYLDDDLHPTTDNIDAPSYFGVEGRLLSDGTIRGHPFVTALGFGLVFNRSSSGGLLNSTRVLAYWSLVNPWTAGITGFHSSYTVELSINVSGNAGGGNLGPEAQAYFDVGLNERLNEGPPDLPSRSGAVYPNSPSGLSFANFKSFFSAGNQQPAGMTFSGIQFRVSRARLLFQDSSGIQSVVQVLDGLSGLPVDMVPGSFTLPSSRGSTVYNPGTMRAGLFLNGDPRKNFDSSQWIRGTLSDASINSSLPPRSTPIPNVFSTMSANDGDGQQGLPSDQSWYSSNATTNHFFVRSPPLLPGNPATNPFNPSISPTGLAVDSIAEMGYLFTGRPWQTLRMVSSGPGGREDYRLLDFLDSGTFATLTDSVGRRFVSGKVNLNTALSETARGLFQGIPGLGATDVSRIASLISSANASDGNYPLVGAGDIGSSTNMATPGATTKFAREDLMRRTANLFTTRSRIFTVTCLGQARDPRQEGKVLSQVYLDATVRLDIDAAGNPSPVILSQTYR